MQNQQDSGKIASIAVAAHMRRRQMSRTSAAKRATRQADMDAANRSCEMAGLSGPSRLDAELQARIVAGEMTVARAIEILGNHYRQPANAGSGQ